MLQWMLSDTINTLQTIGVPTRDAHNQCSLSVCSHHHPTLTKPPYMGVRSMAGPPHIVVSVVSVVSVV